MTDYTPILHLPQVASNQEQKEATINTAIAILEAAMNDTLAYPITTAEHDLTVDDFTKYFLIQFQQPGLLAGDIAVTVPATPRWFAVENQTEHLITIAVAGVVGGATIDIGVGKIGLVASDGFDLRFVVPDPTGGVGILTDLSDVAGVPNDGQILRYYEDENNWKPWTFQLTWNDLADAPNYGFTGNNGKLLAIKADGSGLEWVSNAANINSFIQLDDVPGSYDGHGGKHVIVGGGETGLTFVVPNLRENSDFPSSYSGQDGKWLRVDTGGGVEFAYPSVADIADGPDAPTFADALWYVRVNAAGTALEYAPGTSGPVNFTELLDCPSTYDNQALKLVRVGVDEDQLIFDDLGFLELNDTPNTYVGHAGKFVRVNSVQSAVEFMLPTVQDLSNGPGSFAGMNKRVVRVNASANALEYVALSILDLAGFPTSFTGQGGKFLQVRADETGVQFVSSAFSASFLVLTDTPDSYFGQANKMVVVDGSGTGLVFATRPPSITNIGDLADVETGTGTPTQGAFLRWVDGVWQADVLSIGENAVESLGDLIDVELGTGTPAENSTLTWKNGVWQAEPKLFVPSLLAQLADVEGGTGTPVEGYVLTWKNGVWQPEPGGTGSSNVDSLGDLSDVEMGTGPTENYVLTWKDGVAQFEPPQGGSSNVAALSDLTDVEISTSLLDGYVLTWKDGVWQPEPAATGTSNVQSLGDLDDVEAGTGTPTEGYVLTWKDGVWQAEPSAAVAASSLASLTDVELGTGTPVENAVLTYKDGVWQAEPGYVTPFIPSLIGQLADVELGTGAPAENSTLSWKNGVWQAEPALVIPFVPSLIGQLADVELGTGTPAENSTLTWKNGVWQAEPKLFVPSLLGQLADVETGTGTPAAGSILMYRDGVWQPEELDVSTVTSFVDLVDVPASYAGHNNEFVQVNNSADGLEFAGFGADLFNVPPEFGAHRYWRVSVSDVDNPQLAGAVAIAEIEWRATVGGIDQATISIFNAGTNSDYNPGYDRNAYDDSNASWWGSTTAATSGSPKWNSYDFVTPVSVGEVAIRAHPTTFAYSTYGSAAPKDFKIEWSDNGSAWTTAWEVTGEDGWSVGEQRVYAADGALGVAFRTLLDTPDTYVGQGGKLVAVADSEGALEFIDVPFIPSLIGQLADVELGTGTPAANSVLTYKGGIWQAEPERFIPSLLDHLTDVEVGTAPLLEDMVLTYKNGVWQAEPLPAGVAFPSLGQLTDVEVGTGTPGSGYILTYHDGIWQPEPPNGAVVPGQYVYVEVPLVNGGAETGSTSGWTATVGGGFDVIANGVTHQGHVVPSFSGSYLFHAKAVVTAEMTQVVDMSAYGTEIDAGDAVLECIFHVRNTDPGLETGRVRLYAYDASDVLLDQGQSPGLMTAEDTWVQGQGYLALPVGTRKVGIAIRAERNSGTNNNIAFDGITARIRTTAASLDTYGSLDSLTDVELGTGTPAANAVLTYKDGIWQAEALPAAPFVPSLIGQLADVELGTGTPAENAVLTYKDGIWQAEALPAAPFVPSLIGQLADVELGTGTPAENAVLTWKDGVWQAEMASAAGASSLTQLTDVELGTGTPAENSVLTYKDGVWQAEALPSGLDTPALGDLINVELGTGTPAENAVLTYKDGVWQAETLPAPPFVPTLIEHLADVELGTGTPAENSTLTYKDGVWQAEPALVIPFVPSLIGQLADVELGTGTPTENAVLTWKNGVWQAETPVAPTTSLAALSDVDMTPGPNQRAMLEWRDLDQKWVPGLRFDNGPHQYWRVRALAAQTASVQIAEVRFGPDDGGGDTWDYYGTGIGNNTDPASDVENAFDLDNGTAWLSDGLDGDTWIGKNFGQPLRVRSVFMRDFDDGIHFGPSEFVVEYSDDGTTWMHAWADSYTWTSGDIYVSDVDGYANRVKLHHISDINTPTPTNGQVLTWDDSNNEWIASDVPEPSVAFVDLQGGPGYIDPNRILYGDPGGENVNWSDLAITQLRTYPDHGAHTYWRLEITGPYTTEGQSSDRIGIAELQFRALPEGENQCVGGTPFGSDGLTGSSVFEAFDDDYLTLFASQTQATEEDPIYIGYEFPDPVVVQEIDILSRAYDHPDEFATPPAYFKVQYSDDGVTFTDAWAIEGYSGFWPTDSSRQFQSEAGVPGISFRGLLDVPHTYVGEAGKLVRVNATEDGLEFVAAGSGGAASLAELTDVNLDTGTPAEGSVLTYKDGVWQAEAGGSGVAAFTDLTDTPSSYAGMIKRLAIVNDDEDGLEFVESIFHQADVAAGRAHRYWRWERDTGESSWQGVNTFGFYAVNGGPNLADVTNTTTNITNGPGNEANLFDANLASQIYGNGTIDGQPHRITMDLGSGNKAPCYKFVVGGGGTGGFGGERITGSKFEYSDDGATWFSAWTDGTDINLGEALDFFNPTPPGSGAYAGRSGEVVRVKSDESNVEFAPFTLATLDDVEYGTGTPAANSVLTYKDGVWQAEPARFIPSTLDHLTDVELGTATPASKSVLTRVDGLWQAEAVSLNVSMSASGVTHAPSGVGEVWTYIFLEDATFADDFTGSILKAGTAAAASTVFTLKKNASTIGTITVASTGTTGTFVTTGGATTFVAGDVLTIHCPNTPDTTLADIGIALKGYKT